MTKVAADFGVSGTYLARICRILEVPRPERGYWAKLAVGKAPMPKPLPAPQPGTQLHWTRTGETRPPPKPKRPPNRHLGSRVRVSRSRVHGLISGARAHFGNTRTIEEGDYLRPYKKLLVDVTASEACLEKALAFANDLFNGFESVGHRVLIAPAGQQLRRADPDVHEVPRKAVSPSYFESRFWRPYRPTVVYVGDVALGLAIVEMSEDVLLRYVGGKYVRESDYKSPPRHRPIRDYTWTTNRDLPSGRLRLVVYSPYWRVNWSTAWDETRNASLRPKIRSIIEATENAAVELVPKLEEADRQAEIERQEQQAAEERYRMEQDRKQVAQSIQESTAHLNQIIQQWSQAVSVEQFLEGIEERASRLPAAEKELLQNRLKLAREFLGTQDPLDFFRSWKTPEERYRPLFPRQTPKRQNDE